MIFEIKKIISVHHYDFKMHGWDCFFVWDYFAMRSVCPRVVRDCRTFTLESVVEKIINACSVLTEKI
jgi:hypothetical protein